VPRVREREALSRIRVIGFLFHGSFRLAAVAAGSVFYIGIGSGRICPVVVLRRNARDRATAGGRGKAGENPARTSMQFEANPRFAGFTCDDPEPADR
jgi:hypothetical protein